MSVYVVRGLSGKGSRGRLKTLKRLEAIERQRAAIRRGTDRRTGMPYVFAPLSKFSNDEAEIR